MFNYLFLVDSYYVLSKLVKFLPNVYQDIFGLLQKYEYKGNNIYINKIPNDEYYLTKIFKDIGNFIFKFDKIFVLSVHVTNYFKEYVNGLAHNLVKSQTDVILFRLNYEKSNYYFNDEFRNEKMLCYFLCCCYKDPRFVQFSKAIYVDINKLYDLDCNPDYFINYLSKNNCIISEKIIRDEEKTNSTIPVVVAKLISDTNNDYIKVNTEPSVPPFEN